MKSEDLAKLTIERPAKFGQDQRARKAITPWAWLLLAAAITLGTWWVWGIRSGGHPVKIGSVSSLYPSQEFTLLNATGYVVPATKADVASKATGRLDKLEVEEGSIVKKDQVLARLENQDLVATVNQALANVEVAKTDLKKAEAELRESTLALRRAEALLRKKFVSQEVYDIELARHDKAVAAVNSARASIVAAEAAYKGAQVAVDYTLIRAPFDGVILSKHADVGDILAPFAAATESKGSVVSMADMSTLEVEADVSESNLLKVKVGQPCEIQLDALPDARLRGTVNRIVPTVDRTKATVLVKVGFVDKDSRVLPDMSAKVAFLSQELTPEQQKPLTAVPSSAIVERDGASKVFLVQGNSVRETSVETGGKIGDFMIVNKGLKPGDQVVLEPPEQLADGSNVRPER